MCPDEFDSRHLRIESKLPISSGAVWSRFAIGFDIETERNLLGILDEHMNYESNRRFPNSMMLGLCIRRLSLYYRRKLIDSQALGKLTFGVKRLSSLILDFQESVRSLYDGCISAYSKVYHKGKSPYSLIWRSQDHIEEFGNDAGLAEMFEQIRTEERIFCASTTLLRLTFLIPNYNRRGS